MEFWRYYSADLPKGLIIDKENGTITGAPLEAAMPAVFVITCSNPVGEVSVELKFEVQEAPSDFLYLSPDSLYKVDCAIGYKRKAADSVTITLSELGEAFECNTLTYIGSKVVFSCDPPLPNGLRLNPKDGSISGTPTSVTTQKGKPGRTEPIRIRVTGKNQVAASSVQILIEVAREPTLLKYKRPECAYCIGEAIEDNEVLHCNGTPPYFFAVTRDPVATRACFNRYDKDGSGSLELAEFRDFVRDLGERLSEAELRWLVLQVDGDQSGSIDFDEFWEWWKPLPYGLELDERTGTIYGRPLRRCAPAPFVATVWNKVGSFATTLRIQVLDLVLLSRLLLPRMLINWHW